VSRGPLVAIDRSSGRRSPMKAGDGAVRSLSVIDSGQGHRGGGSEGGGVVHGHE
jgi:hypothetical protein